jgi:hypothetical protein
VSMFLFVPYVGCCVVEDRVGLKGVGARGR